MTDPNLTSLCLIVDRSGSMTNIAADMNGGIATLLKDQEQQPGECFVDVFTFDNAVEHVVTWTIVGDPALDHSFVLPRGSTALNDAIGTAVQTLGQRFAAMDEDERPGTVIVAVVTDGMENSSREWTAEKVKALVTQQTEQWGWTFMYLAANVDAFATGGALGFDPSHSMAYAGTAKGSRGMTQSVSAAVTRTRGGTFTGYTEDERDAAAER